VDFNSKSGWMAATEGWNEEYKEFEYYEAELRNAVWYCLLNCYQE
jgi:hypothetical protein